MEKRRQITYITRQQIIDRLLLDDVEPFYGKSELIPFLKRIWPLSHMPSTDNRFKDAEGDIWQHTVNNEDWSFSELLYERLKIVEIPDEQFARFLETRVHPLFCRDRTRQDFLVQSFNEELKTTNLNCRRLLNFRGVRYTNWRVLTDQEAWGMRMR